MGDYIQTSSEGSSGDQLTGHGQSVRETDGIEPSFISDIPAAVAHAVNSKTVALGPVPVNFTNIVETGWIIISRLEVLRLMQPVRVRESGLAELFLAGRSAKTSDFRDVMASITCNNRDGTAHGGSAACNADSGHAWDHLNRSCLGLRAEDDRLLMDERLANNRRDSWLLNIDGLLGDNIASLNASLRCCWLLQTKVSTSIEE